MNLEIENCGYSDQTISEILDGILGQKCLRSLKIKNEDIGIKSVDRVCQLLARKRPNSLVELELSGCSKLNLTTTQKLLVALEKCNLARLVLSGFKLLQKDDHSTDEGLESLLCQFLQAKADASPNIQTEILIDIDLSNLSLPQHTMVKVLNIFSFYKRLEYLNLSGNYMHEQVWVSQFVQKLDELLKFNTKTLKHLDVRNILGNQALFFDQKLILQTIKESSKGLQSFHFTDFD